MKSACCVLWCLFVAACVRPASETCPDGTVCPEGKSCVGIEEHYYCVTSDQLGCTDPAAPCELPGGTLGSCHTGVCLPDECGNGLVDLGEACDDGNVVGGDGCSADCRSAEGCGDGVTDPRFGEQCDDHNLASHDGCSTDCRIETPRWQKVLTGMPSPHANFGMVYDTARERTVMFGGFSSEDTWEWDGAGWTAEQLSLAPTRREGNAMAYDQARRRTVMFGGLTQMAGELLADTWLWDGSHWDEVGVLVSPPARIGHVMAYDAARKRTVLFGGSTAAGLSAETWEFDGGAWTHVVPPVSPPAVERAMLAYDPARARVVLFGGKLAAGGFSAETWGFDGTTWTKLVTPPAISPPAREGGVLAFDRASQRLVLFGGFNVGFLADTWAWDGAAWTNVTPVPAVIAARNRAAMAADPSGGLVLFGGTDGANRSETYTWNGSTWAAVVVEGPPILQKHAAVLDPERRRIVTFGGAFPSVSADTWELMDAHWHRVSTVATPAPRLSSSVTYDRDRHEVVMFGGRDTQGPSSDGTWTYADTTWTQRATGSQSPPARSGGAMTYDAARRNVVLFGGVPMVGSVFADTWTWDGSTWHQANPAVSPPARTAAMMAYDERNRRTYLFGGTTVTGTPQYLSDTWEWDGVTWRKVATPLAPPARTLAGFAWDRARQRLVLAGGLAPGTLDMKDVWDWDGVVWSRSEATLPEGRSGGVLVTSAGPAGVELIGGSGANNPISGLERFRLRWESSISSDGCKDGADLDHDGLVGCADPDCWVVCAPSCPPSTSCDPAAPRCGDGTCNAALETCALCPADCGACAASCGDGRCTGETAASCPGDCAP